MTATSSSRPSGPGGAVEVPEGYDISFPQQPATDSNYEQFARVNLAEVAVCLGLAIEHITLNFEKVNDRVYRAIMLEVTWFIESIQHHMVVQQFCVKVWRRFVSAAILSEKWTPPADARPEDYMRVEWRTPARGHIHPLQEVLAFSEAVKNGFTSRSKTAADYGQEVEDIDIENARDMARTRELGLHLPGLPVPDRRQHPHRSGDRGQPQAAGDGEEGPHRRPHEDGGGRGGVDLHRILAIRVTAC